MIGLVDYDALTTIRAKSIRLNLEIMKLASYYRTEENETCKLLSLQEEDLDSYRAIYFFSEEDSYPEVPPQFYRVKNVVFGGSAFTNHEYVPFENSLIDYSLPRTFIYKELLSERMTDGVDPLVIKHALDDTYYRMYAGSNKLPLPAIQSNKRVILYDREFFYPDWKETIQRISDRAPSGIFRIHPVVCKKLGQYFELRDCPKFVRSNAIVLDLDIPLKDTSYLFKHYKNRFLADINQTAHIFLRLGGDFPTPDFYYKDFRYKMNLLYAFWGQGIPIKIRYMPANIGYNDPLNLVGPQVEIWTRTQFTKKGRELVLNDKIERKKKTPAMEQRNQLTHLYPETKDLFQQSFESLKERGYWKV